MTSERFGMYTMPSNQVMHQNLKQTEAAKKQRLLIELSNNENQMEGMLAVRDVQNKKRFTSKDTKVQDYVNHFSHIADTFAVENKSGNRNAAFDFG